VWNIFILGLLLTTSLIPAFAVDSDSRELETFFDSFMAEKLPDLNIPGASVVVVQDGEIVARATYYVLLCVPILTALLTLVLLGGTVLSWVRGYGSLLMRLANVVIVMNSIVFLWWVNYWNLLGFHF
jgi:hypothetical protein